MAADAGMFEGMGYVDCKLIGRGGYGLVYRVVDSRTGLAKAVKLIPKEGIGMDSNTMREVAFLRDLQHPHIVHLENGFSLMGFTCLVFEHMDTTLADFLETRRTPHQPSLTKRLLRQLLQAVAHCHASNIMHRDVKPSNILLSETADVLKLADFGLARSIDVATCTLTREVVTLWYRAPEILFGSSSYGAAIDVWSVGCIFAELITAQPLFPGKRCEVDQICRIIDVLGMPPPEMWTLSWPMESFLKDMEASQSHGPRGFAALLPELEPAGHDLLLGLLCYNPSLRMTAQQALNHPYFD